MKEISSSVADPVRSIDETKKFMNFYKIQLTRDNWITGISF